MSDPGKEHDARQHVLTQMCTHELDLEPITKVEHTSSSCSWGEFAHSVDLEPISKVEHTSEPLSGHSQRALTDVSQNAAGGEGKGEGERQGD